jgi:hypothetical protein
MTALSPEQVLATLKASARPQTCRALDVVNSVCAQAHQLGGRDFSLATIGRLTEQRHGPSMRTLYNAKSAHYRALIKAWADYVAKTHGQSDIAPAKPFAEDDLLRKIDDPALRGLLGAMIAERNRLRSEVTLLRAQANIVVDRRVFPGDIRPRDGQFVQVLTGSHQLLPLEKEALLKAISADFLKQEGWSEGADGEILNTKGRRLYGLGYATAIRKLLGEHVG